MPGGHSEWVPPLPIPNRTVKPLSADDSTDTRAKVGHRQAPHQGPQHMLGAFALVLSGKREGIFAFGTFPLFHMTETLTCNQDTCCLFSLAVLRY